MITYEGVSYDIGGAPILRDVALSLPRGRLTALIGPNGAGKSTLLSLAARLARPRRGRVLIDDLDAHQADTTEIARRLAFMGQTLSVGTRLRVAELVGFGRWPHHQGRPGPADRDAVDAALENFALAPVATRFLDELSGGQRQRAFLAMAFAQGADWLLLDEPMNNLDIGHARALAARLRDLTRAQGRSVVVVMHDVNYAAAWADHVVALKDGQVAAQGTPDEVLTAPVLARLYDADLAVRRIDGKPYVLHHL